MASPRNTIYHCSAQTDNSGLLYVGRRYSEAPDLLNVALP